MTSKDSRTRQSSLTPDPQLVLKAISQVRPGRSYDLDSERFPGLPIQEGHPPFQVLTYRSPAGITYQRVQDWLAPEKKITGATGCWFHVACL